MSVLTKLLFKDWFSCFIHLISINTRYLNIYFVLTLYLFPVLVPAYSPLQRFPQYLLQ